MGKIDENVFASILEDLGEHGISLRKSLVARNVHNRDFFNYINANHAAAEQYARARQTLADIYAESIIDIGEQARNGEISPDAARVAIDARKWIAARMRPKRWGDRVDHNVNGEIHVKRMLLNDEVDSPKALPQVIDVESKESND